ncbi:hypothetical protein ACOSQ2_019572 [Xanthoceras sorbifolium]
MEDLKEAVTKGAKAVEYKMRAKQARGIIARLRKQLSDCAIDWWVKTEEYMDALDVEYVRGSTETKFLISRVDPNFNFDSAFLQPTEAAIEEEVPKDSLDKDDIVDSDDDVEVVNPTE